jgi:ferredoxin
MKRTPIIDETRCTGCGHCTDICPEHALILEEQQSSLWRALLGFGLPYKARLLYPQACIGCGHCASVCRHRAISIEKITAPANLSEETDHYPQQEYHG